MSSEKTPNLTMHKWGPKDPMNRLEWNENFQKIDDHSKQVAQQLAHIAVNPQSFGAVGDGVTDDTVSIQSAIDSLRVGGTLNGGNKTYLVQSLHLKSDMNMENFKLISKAGSTPLQSPITIGAYNDINVRKNIIIKNVQINGNRANQTNLSTSEDGGRHGFRLIGAIENLLIIDSSANYCATDGIELYAGLGMDSIMSYDKGIKRNIRIVNCQFNYNRRHGGSGDTLDGVTFENCEFNNNGLDVDGGLTEGNKGALSVGLTYGNGFDMEEYTLKNYAGNVTFKSCKLVKNARAGVLFFLNSAIKANDSNFISRKNINLIDCEIDNGVNNHEYAIEITPTASNASLGKHFENVFFTDCKITGGVSIRSTDNILINGGSIKNGSTYLGNLEYATGMQIGNTKTNGKKFYATNSDIKYPFDLDSTTLFPEGVRTTNLFTLTDGAVKTFSFPNTRGALLALTNVTPERSALIAIGEASAVKLSGWSEVITANTVLDGTTGTEGKVIVSFFNKNLYIENQFGYTLTYSITILGD